MMPREAIKVTIIIHHFHIDHNLCTLFTLKILHFVFSFSWILQSYISREILNIEKNVYAKFWGQTRCIMVYVKIVNRWIFLMIQNNALLDFEVRSTKP